MEPERRIENAIRQAGSEASDGMRQRLWNDIADQLHQSQTTTQRRGETRVWRLLMNSKIARLAVAAVIVLAALAVGVERLTRTKPSKVQAFCAQIRTDMALDLDPAAALPLRTARPEDFDVTWSSVDGGSLQILPGSSLRLLACPLIDPQWDSAISWAYSHLDELQESTATRVTATKSEPFVVVLTSEGNLAVIDVAGHKANHAWLRWRIEEAVSPGYSPVQTVTLRIVDPQGNTAEDGAVDLDTGRILSIPTNVLGMPPAEMLGWLEQNGIDAIARRTEEGYGLIGVGLVFWTWSPGSWAGTGAVDLREEMTSSPFQPRRPLLYQESQYQYVYPFKTREGAIGMLQMLAVDTSTQTIQFRWRMVADDAASAVETTAEEDLESQRLAESVKRLKRFGLMAFIYAEEHDGKYPATIDELKDYAARCDQDFQWVLDNVGYVGAGRVAQDAPDTLIAYDKTLLAIGKGTYAAFRDGHAEFIEPDRLSQYDLSAATIDAEEQRLAESEDKLMKFAIVLMRYAQRHDETQSDTLSELKEYVEECGQDYQWIVENVEYLGKGAKMGIDPSVPVAYDKTLAARGRGTYVLYSDPCAQFWGAKELEERGILEPIPGMGRQSGDGNLNNTGLGTVGDG